MPAFTTGFPFNTRVQFTGILKVLLTSPEKREERTIGNRGKLVVYYQVASPENMYESNIIQTEQVIFRNKSYTYAFIHAITTSLKKEAMNFKEIRDGYMGGVGVRKGKDKWNIIIIIILKNKNMLYCQKGQRTASRNSWPIFCLSSLLFHNILFHGIVLVPTEAHVALKHSNSFIKGWGSVVRCVWSTWLPPAFVYSLCVAIEYGHGHCEHLCAQVQIS